MESIFAYICDHAEHAHLIIFVLIMLTGIGVPISEEVLLLIAGGIASTCVPDHAVTFYIWIFFACWLSAWEAYWIGRLLGPKLLNIGWFKHIVTPKRLEKLTSYYKRFGIFTFIIGRFIPGGVRAAIFLSSGLTKMPFHVFILRDGIACLIASLTMFYIGYLSGQNIHTIIHDFELYEKTAIITVISLIFSAILIYWLYKKKGPANVANNSD
ncbi:MAG: DedA family protein [Parachlamydiaceae bacterium]|nr:DedA family protein [Parachlamydiaceae bacterium]